MKARAEAVQDRVRDLMSRARDALMALYDDVNAVQQKNPVPPGLNQARALVRRLQFRVDFVNAENSRGFHAPHEAERLLAEAIDYARQGQLAPSAHPLTIPNGYT